MKDRYGQIWSHRNAQIVYLVLEPCPYERDSTNFEERYSAYDLIHGDMTYFFLKGIDTDEKWERYL